MTFISHAQNREDVLLWRALKHVKKGFYVDVGANHPSHDSVTKAFYDRGWSGINIEPLPIHFEELQRVRLRDINLQVAAGATQGEIDLYDSDVRGLATASVEVAQARRAAGGVVRQCRVPVMRLDTILATHAPDPIHFLKVDVEGFEASVLEGMDFSKWRPWVVVIEATKPNSRELELGWEPLLTRANYQWVWFDGLNRYYLASEHMDLAVHFQSPPNVFDEFVPAEQERLRLALEKIQSELENNAHQSQAHQQVMAESQRLQSQLDSVLTSRSWQLTRPLRLVIQALKALKKKVVNTSAEAAPSPLPVQVEVLVATPLPRQVFTYWHEAAYPRTARAPVLLPLSTQGAELQWRLTGHLEGHYSLAEVNRSLALALDPLTGGRVQFVPWHGQQYAPDASGLHVDQSQDLQRMITRAARQGIPTVSLVHHYPPLKDPEAADLRLALFFWEESLVPPDLVSLFNTSVDGVLVASQFVHRALRHSGCDRPIFVVPLGVPVPQQQACSAEPQARSAVFRFLHVSSAFERKGVDVLLDAYGAAFSGDDAVELYIKTFANPHHDIERQVDAWRSQFSHPPVVIIDVSELDDPQMDALYQTAHAMVLPSRGEGFGLPAARALAMGTPLITTAGSGQADFAALAFADLVPYHCAPSRSHVNSGDAYWLEPEVAALVHQLRSVHASALHPTPETSARIQRAAQWVSAHYNWGQSAAHVQSVARQLFQHTTHQASTSATRRQRLGIVSPWRTTCGIAEYAHALFEGWDATFDVRVYCDDRTPPDSTQQVYAPVWQLGDQESVLRVLQTLRAQAQVGELDVLFVQHQQSLFLLTDAVCGALREIRELGVQVMLELHSTLPMVREGRLGRRAAQALRHVDLVLVHKLDDVNYMLGLGLSDNVMHLPHAVATLKSPAPADARQRFGWADDDWVLGCFGILWPHKGVDTVIQSMPLIAQASGKRVRLLAVTAVIDDASRQMWQTCRDLADSLGVGDDIVWVTDFLPIQESMRTLSMADVQLFVYGPTRESASGAVTIGLATHQPVWVSPQDIFSDLSSCTYTLQGMTPQDVAQGMLAQMRTPHVGSDVYVAQQTWLQSRSWSHASERLQATIRGLKQDRQHLQAFDIAHDSSVHQLLVDVTQISLHDSGTGIQRVVRNILRQWLSNPPAGFEVYPVRFDQALGQYCYAPTSHGPASRPRAGVGEPGEAVQPAMGDIFVGLDLTAHLFPQMEPLLTQWRMHGVRVCYVVYDIIPLLYPSLAYPGTPQAFDAWARVLRRQSDRVVCISNAVADELRLWWCAHTEEGALPEISSFHLGADLESGTPPAPTAVSPDFAQANLARAVLMVGTVEPRKGHAMALDAFESLWAQGSEAVLVVVGKPGWQVDALCEKIKSHPQLGQHLFWFENCSDTDLQHLYRHCQGLLMASQAEGFGLPLMEAAQHGLPILARDIAVFKELAGPHVSYFAAQDGPALAPQLLAWLHDVEQGLAPRSHGIERLSWQTSAQQLLEEIL